MLHSVKPKLPVDDLTEASLVVTGTADEVIGVENSTDERAPQDAVAGFLVMRSAKGKHDGFPAVTLTLADEMGNREVGRMTVRIDATHEEILTWERHFPHPVLAQAFLEKFEKRDLVPSGWRKIKARQVEVGMLVADTELWPEAYPVRSMHLFPLEEDGPFSRDTLPSGVGVAFDAWADPFDSEDDVLVKES